MGQASTVAGAKLSIRPKRIGPRTASRVLRSFQHVKEPIVK